MARNVSLACRILRHHNTTRGESADVTIARLEFNLPSEPEYKQSLRRIVPIHFSHARRDVLLCIVCIGLSGAGAGVKKSTTPLPTTGGGLDKGVSCFSVTRKEARNRFERSGRLWVIRPALGC